MLLLHLLSRQPHLTHEEFIDHWYNVHAELARKHADALGIQRYVQFHPGYQRVVDAMNSAREGEANFGGEWDGVAMTWRESEEAYLSHVQSEAGQAALAEIIEDEPKFSNYRRSIALFGDTVPIIGGNI